MLTWLNDKPPVRLLFLGCCFGLSCLAQEPTQDAPERAREVPGLSKRAITRALPFLSPTQDVGHLELVTVYPRPKTLTLETSQNFFYTDNAPLTGSNEVSSIAWGGRFGLSLVPYSTLRWTPRLSLEHFMFRYERDADSDFDGQILTLSSALELEESRSLTWDSSYTLWRFEGAHDGEEFLKLGELINSLSWIQSLSRDGSFYGLASAGVVWRHASPARLDRVEGGVLLSLGYAPAPSVSLEAYVEPAAYIYTNDTAAPEERRDFHLRAGLFFLWRVHSNFQLGGNLSWIGNYSTVHERDYDELSAGISLFARVGF